MVLLFIFCFLVFLFCLYSLGNDDLVMLRKNVTAEKIFNLAFLLGFVFLLFARIFYVAFNFRPGFLNPLVFFLFPYFPGLSLMGGVVGTIIFLSIFTAKKLPGQRFFDLYALCFLLALAIGLLILLPFNHGWDAILLSVLTIIFYGVVFKYISYLFLRGKLSDGTAGAVVVEIVSFMVFLTDLLHFQSPKISYPELFLDTVVFLIAGFYVMKKEKILRKLLTRRKNNA